MFCYDARGESNFGFSCFDLVKWEKEIHNGCQTEGQTGYVFPNDCLML